MSDRDLEQPGAPRSDDRQIEVVRYEEQLQVATTPVEAGRVRVRKTTEVETAEQTVARQVERANIEYLPPFEDDNGEVITYEDGSISVPVFEEEIFVTKRSVIRERVLIRKSSVVEPTSVTVDLEKERVTIEADDAVADRVTAVQPASPAP